MADKNKDQKERNKLLQKELNLNEAIKKARKSGASEQEKKLRIELAGTQEKINKLLEISDKIHGSILSKTKDHATELGDISKILTQHVKSGKEFGRLQQVVNDLIHSTANESKIYADILKHAADETSNIKNITEAMTPAVGYIAQLRREELDNLTNIGDRELQSLNLAGAKEAMLRAEEAHRVGLIDLADQEAQLMKDIEQAKKEGGQIDLFTGKVQNAKAIALANQLATLHDQRAEANQYLNDLKGSVHQLEFAAGAYDTLIEKSEGMSAAVMAPFDALESAIGKLPFGGQLSKILGLGAFKKEMTSIVTESIQKGLIGPPGGLTEGVGKFKELVKSSKVLQGIMKFAFSPIGIALVTMTALVAVYGHVAKHAKEIAEKTGLSVTQSKELYLSSKHLQESNTNLLSSTEDIVAVQSTMVEQFGRMDMLSDQAVLNVSEIGKAFGYGAAEAAKVQSSLMLMGADEKFAENIQIFTASLSEAAGVAPGKVMKDIAKSSKTAAKYFAGTPKALAKAAVYAAKIGVSLDEMAATAENFLDIEGSLTSQFEAQALLGKPINFDAARRLALEGDLVGMSKEVLKEAGSYKELQGRTLLEKKAIAKAAGMEVDQLLQATMLAEKTKDMTKEEADLIAKMNLSAAEMADLDAQSLLARGQQAQKTDQVMKSFEKVKNTFISALLPAAEGLMAVFQGIEPIIKGLLAPFHAIGKVITWIKELWDELSLKFEWASGLVTVISTVLETMGGIIGGVLIPYMVILAGKALINAGLAIAQAIGSIFASFAKIPFGLGIPAAFGVAGAVAALYTKFSSVGDLAMDPNGGPVVASPKEGTLFQGTKNDGVSMSPGHGASGGGGTDMSGVVSALNQIKTLLTAIDNKEVQIVVGDRVVDAIKVEGSINSSYRIGTGGALVS